MKKADALETNAQVLKRVWRARALSCSRCPPNRKENRKQSPKKHGTRPPKSKNRFK